MNYMTLNGLQFSSFEVALTSATSAQASPLATWFSSLVGTLPVMSHIGVVGTETRNARHRFTPEVGKTLA